MTKPGYRALHPPFRLPFVLLSLLLGVTQGHSDEAPAVDVEAIADRIQTVSFESTILGTRKTFCAVLPEGCDKSGAPSPVLFLFHGRGRHERSLIPVRAKPSSPPPLSPSSPTAMTAGISTPPSRRPTAIVTTRTK